MINAGNGIIPGQMRINGVADQEAGAQAAKNGKLLASGLRIRGQAQSGEAASISNLTITNSGAGPSSATDTAAKKQNAGQNFAATLLSRLDSSQLKADSDDKKTLVESQALVDGLMAVIDEIQDKFGQNAANQAMAEILTNTESGLNANRIANAISGVLQGLANNVAGTMNNSEVTAEEYEEALKTEEKLKEFRNFLNQESINAGGKELQGLSAALNSYFGNPSLAEDEQKQFGDDFSWMSANEIAEKQANKADSLNLTLSVKELGQLNVDELVKFLREEIGHEEAARYIENLGEDDDIFNAVDVVRNMFYENSAMVNPGIDPETGFPGLRRREGEGVDQVVKLNDFLHFNMLDAVNSAFRNNPELSERLTSYAAANYGGNREAVPAGVGLISWPGGRLPQGPTDVNAPRDTYLADIGQTTTLTRQENLLSQMGDFWREVGKAHGEQGRAQYEKYAQGCDQDYQDYLLGKKKMVSGFLVDIEA